MSLENLFEHIFEQVKEKIFYGEPGFIEVFKNHIHKFYFGMDVVDKNKLIEMAEKEIEFLIDHYEE